MIMKNSLKQSAFFAVFLVLLSCSNRDGESDDRPHITVTASEIAGLPADVDEIRAMLYYQNGYIEFASSKISRGGFTVRLHNQVDQNYLTATFNEDIIGLMEATDGSVRMCELDFLAYSNGKLLGMVKYTGDFPEISYNVQYTFADRDSSISGILPGIVIDMSITEGWNAIVYANGDSYKGAYTDIPEGLGWTYDVRSLFY